MFTGIIETIGIVKDRIEEDGNVLFEIESDISKELQLNQSISHNGACLSVTRTGNTSYWVTVIRETLKKTALGELKPGVFVNLERSMPANGRFDGHIVLGHVDTVGVCRSVEMEKGSHIFTFEHEKTEDFFTVEKGSICVNGISLTVFNSQPSRFSVAIIPYTYDHTNMKSISVGNKVNLEFDVLGKYMKRILQKN